MLSMLHIKNESDTEEPAPESQTKVNTILDILPQF